MHEPQRIHRYKWTYFGFERAGRLGAVEVHTRVRTPLFAAGVLLQANVTHSAGSAVPSPWHVAADGDASTVTIDLFPQIREYPAARINCSERQWRYPANMDSAPCADGAAGGYCARNCWNWYAPRPFGNESADFVGTFSQHGDVALLTYVDKMSSAVTAIAVHSVTPCTPACSYRCRDAPFGKLPSTSLSWDLPSKPGGRLSVDIAIAFGPASSLPALQQQALAWAGGMDAAMDAALQDRQVRFDSVFDPDPRGRYTGSLPVLETQDSAVARVYYGGIASLLEVERATSAMPHAPPNTTHVYVTGAGSNASTNAFFWDPSYCASVMTMLNPAMVRASLLQWLRPNLGGKDGRAGWGVDFYSGRAVGNHYAANDMALFKLTLHYIQQTGDFDFVHENVAGRPVLSWMADFATAYRNLSRGGGPGELADYGPASALLECVPTYQHKVASFNAANVWMMQRLALLLLATGRPADRDQAHELQTAATAMITAVLSLYVPGKGFWHALYPNGSALPVQHVIDFAYVSEFMSEHLGPQRQQEMCNFARQRLLTSTWMRALSASDPAAAASDRTDHGPFGAYDGWVALTVAAFARSGVHELAADFLRNTSFVTTLGPYGQAHGIAATALRSEHTYKPFEFTLANELAGADFPEAVISAIFGLQPAVNVSLQARSPPVADPTAPRGIIGRLRNVRWQGELYDAVAGPSGVEWTRVNAAT